MAVSTFDTYYAAYQDTENKVWASAANSSDISQPSDVKTEQGWAIEKPKHSYFNWWQNRTDMRLRKLEAKVAWLEAKLEELADAADAAE